jgi:hypothetical protein
MDSNLWYRGTKARDFGSVPGIADGSSTGESGVGGLHTRETPPSSEELARAYKPYIEACIAAFGPDRGIFESNFPLDGVRSSYAVLWNAFKLLAAGYSPEDKAKLFSGTAKASTVSPRSRWRLSLTRASRSGSRRTWRRLSPTEKVLCPLLIIVGTGDPPHQLGRSDVLELARRHTLAQRLQRVVHRLHRGRERSVRL